MKRRRARLLWTVIILLAIIVGLQIANAIRFTVVRPADMAGGVWEGEWSSDSYPLIGGRLIAELPDPIPVGKPFEAQVLVYYNLWSLHRPGGTLRMTVDGYFGGSGAGSGGTGDFPDSRPVVTFKWKGGGDGRSQSVEYVAVLGYAARQMVGGYVSDGPNDLGRFTLVKTD